MKAQDLINEGKYVVTADGYAVCKQCEGWHLGAKMQKASILGHDRRYHQGVCEHKRAYLKAGGFYCADCRRYVNQGEPQ